MESINSLSPEQELRLECMRMAIDVAHKLIQPRTNCEIRLVDLSERIFEYTITGCPDLKTERQISGIW